MTEQSNAGSTGEQSGGSATPPPASSSTSERDSELESYRNDMHKFKQKAKEAEARLEELERAREEEERKRLEESDDFKSLNERLKRQLEERDQEVNKLRGNVKYSERYRAVLPKLKELHLRDDALNLLDHETLEEIDLEATSNGRFIAHGVDEFAESFKKKYPFAFQEKKTGNVDPRTGRNLPDPSAPISAKDVLEAEKKYKDGKIKFENYQEIYNRFRAGK